MEKNCLDMHGGKQKNCRLDLIHLKWGPVPLSGKLRLVDEFGKATSFGVMPWYTNSMFRTAEFVARMSLITPWIVGQVKMLPLYQQMIASHPLLAAAGVLASIALTTELNLSGTSKYKRTTLPQDWADRGIQDSVDITREQYDALRKGISEKTHYYSFLFNNCIQQSNRVFAQEKKRADDFLKRPEGELQAVPAVG